MGTAKLGAPFGEDREPMLFTWLKAYGGSQNVSNAATVVDPQTLKLSGNTWSSIEHHYEVTLNTVLEVEYRTGSLAEFTAIGIDSDNNWETGPRPFKLAGTQRGTFNEDYAGTGTATGDGWTRVVIELGDYYRGEINALTFINDDDVARPVSSSLFRNVRLYEGETAGSVPAAADDAAATLEDTAVMIDVLGNDGDGLVLQSFTDAGHGTVTRVDGKLLYTPDADYHGRDSFTYVASDGRGNTSTAQVQVVVADVNDAPTAGADSAVTTVGNAVRIDVLDNDRDVDGDPLKLVKLGGAAHGQVSAGPEGSVIYTPKAGFAGTDSFFYWVGDGEASTSAKVDVKVEVKPPLSGGATPGTGGGLADTAMVTKITDTDAGVTYYFAKPVEAGRYWNGDIFVVNNGQDVVITRITPDSNTYGTSTGLRTSNGAEIQPGDHIQSQQGFDSYTRASGAPSYVKGLNVDPGNTGKALKISYADHPDGVSLVKSISNKVVETGVDRSSISDYSVLTVVDEVPPKDAFRPGVVGSDKSSPYTIHDLDMGKLQSVELLRGKPDISDFLDYADATFVSWNTSGEPARALHPSKYHLGYADYQNDKLLDGMIALHTDQPADKKLELYATYVQIGLDYSAAIDSGRKWFSDGGHGNGYKPFVVLAGVALDDDAIKANASPAKGAFSEDSQFFYVGADDIGVLKYEYGAGKSSGWGLVYEPGDLGLPEWKIAGYHNYASPSLDAAYRSIASNGVPITALVMEMLGDGEGKEVWGNDAFFDYADRMQNILNAQYESTGKKKPFWVEFHDLYHDTFKTDDDWTGAPERIKSLDVTFKDGGLLVDLPVFRVDNGSPIVRTDIRYSSDGSNWTILKDVDDDAQFITGLKANTFYYVQARHVNALGEAAWSSNVLPSNADVKTKYLDVIGVNTKGSQYFLSTAYQKELADLYDGFDNLSHARLAANLLSGTAVTGSKVVAYSAMSLGGDDLLTFAAASFDDDAAESQASDAPPPEVVSLVEYLGIEDVFLF